MKDWMKGNMQCYLIVTNEFHAGSILQKFNSWIICFKVPSMVYLVKLGASMHQVIDPLWQVDKIYYVLQITPLGYLCLHLTPLTLCPSTATTSFISAGHLLRCRWLLPPLWNGFLPSPLHPSPCRHRPDPRSQLGTRSRSLQPINHLHPCTQHHTSL